MPSGHKYYVLCPIIFLFAILALCRAEDSCTAVGDEPKINDCLQLIDDEEVRNQQRQDLIDSAAICYQKQLREAEEWNVMNKTNEQQQLKERQLKEGQLKDEQQQEGQLKDEQQKEGQLKAGQVKKKQLGKNKVETKRKKVKKKCAPKKPKFNETLKKKPKRSCAVQLRIDKLKSRCSCGLPKVTATPCKVPPTYQNTVQPLKIKNDTALENNTTPCVTETKKTKCSRKPKGCSSIFAAATPLNNKDNITGIGHNRPKVAVSTIVANPCLPPKEKNSKSGCKVGRKARTRSTNKFLDKRHKKCNRIKEPRRKRHKGCRPESRQCLCNVNILDSLLGDIPANYLKKLKQQQVEEELKKKREISQTTKQ